MLKGWRFPQEQTAPNRLSDFIQASARVVLPSLPRRATTLHCGVNMAVRFAHLLEAGVVDHQIGAKHVEQDVKVFAPQLYRRRG